MTPRTILALLLLGLFLFSSAHAQSPHGVVTGTVTSESGAPLPGAQIVDRALQRGTTADSTGHYTLSGLPPGTHALEFRFVGYQTAVREVPLEAGETITLDVALKTQVLKGEGVTVTGTPRAQSTLKTPKDVDVLGTETLDTQHSAALGAMLSENVAGVSSVQTGAQAGKPVLRGLSGNRIVLLKDGIAQEFFQFGVRHSPPTSANEAERIDVVRGASSILYGSDALGGAINIQTRDAPSAESGKTIAGGQASTSYFSNNNERVGRGALHVARGPFGIRVGGERRVAGNYTAPEAPTFFETGKGGTFGDPKYTGEIPLTNFAQWSGYAQVGYDSPLGQVQLYGDYWSNRQNFLLPGGGPDDSDPSTPPPSGLGQNLEHGNLILKADLTPGSFLVKPRLSVQRSVRQSASPGTTLSDIEDNGGFGDFDYPIDLTSTVYTGRLEVVHPSYYGFSGTLGLEVQRQDATSRGPVELQPSADIWNVGLFAFEEYATGPWTVTGGVRGDVQTVTAAPNERTTNPDLLENDYLTLSGSLGASVIVAEGVALAANLSSGFRAPSVFELYASGVHGGVAAFQRGNPRLDPERAFSGDLSVRVRRDRITAEVTGYVNAIRDFVFLENTQRTAPNGLPIFTSGQTNAVIRGVEARIETQLRPWLHVGGQAAFLGGNGNGLGRGGTDGDLPLLPANKLTGFLHLTPDSWGPLRNPRVELDVKQAFGKDAAGRFEPFSQFDAGFGPAFGTASTRGYTKTDVVAESRLELGLGVPLTVRVAVHNAFDTTYRDFLDTLKGYALSPGRDIQLSLSTSL